MSLAVREEISAYLATTLGALTGITAIRPKRIHWADEITADGAVVIRQASLRFSHEDPDAVVAEQDYEIIVVGRDLDSATAALDTRINAKWALILPALSADDTAGGHAMYGGLVLVGIEPLLDDNGGKFAEVLTITVTFSTAPGDITAQAMR